MKILSAFSFVYGLIFAVGPCYSQNRAMPHQIRRDAASYSTNPMRLFHNLGIEPSNLTVSTEPSTLYIGSEPSTLHVGIEPSTLCVGIEPSTLHVGIEPANLQVGIEPSFVTYPGYGGVVKPKENRDPIK
jgi:hypothetical protein